VEVRLEPVKIPVFGEVMGNAERPEPALRARSKSKIADFAGVNRGPAWRDVVGASGRPVRAREPARWGTWQPKPVVNAESRHRNARIPVNLQAGRPAKEKGDASRVRWRRNPAGTVEYAPEPVLRAVDGEAGLNVWARECARRESPRTKTADFAVLRIGSAPIRVAGRNGMRVPTRENARTARLKR
jgi:hypothetical protein